MKVTVIAAVIMGALVASAAHADTLEGALTELAAIKPGMSADQALDHAQRFIDRLPGGISANKYLANYGFVNDEGNAVAVPVMPLDNIAPVDPSTASTAPQGDASAIKTAALAAARAAGTSSQAKTAVAVTAYHDQYQNLLRHAPSIRVYDFLIDTASNPAVNAADGSAAKAQAATMVLNENKDLIARVRTITPAAKGHAANVVVPIHNDSSAKRAHLANFADNEPVDEVITAKANPIVINEPKEHATASARPDTSAYQQKAAAVTSVPMTAITDTATKPAKQPTSGATSSATISTAGTDSADTVAAVRSDATEAVNTLIDAHNENVDAIEENRAVINSNSAAIASNSNRLDSVEAHDRDQDKRIDNNNKRAMAGIAGALAITGLHYTDSANSLAVGAGNYQGANAMAIGYSHQVYAAHGNAVRFSIQNSFDSQHNVGTAASVAIGW